MDKEDFQSFVAKLEWNFAKSIPNWPHFYIAEKDLPEQAAFRAAKTFVKDSGYIGKFFDLDVFYFDADGWTYWASPLVNPPESKYMLNKCKTEYSYESCVRSGALPAEGFRGAALLLSTILEDADFISLMRESKDLLKTADVPEKQRSILNRHAKRFHALAYVLNEESIQSQCSEAEFSLLKAILADQKENQSFSAKL
jgi:hypothetical protein